MTTAPCGLTSVPGCRRGEWLLPAGSRFDGALGLAMPVPLVPSSNRTSGFPRYGSPTTFSAPHSASLSAVVDIEAPVSPVLVFRFYPLSERVVDRLLLGISKQG